MMTLVVQHPLCTSMSIIALQLQILGCHGATTIKVMTAISLIFGKSDLRLDMLIPVISIIEAEKLIAVKM